MPTLVTGATGFLGCHLVPLLVERLETVRALVRDGTADTELGTLGVEVMRGDVLDEDAVRRAAAGCSVVFHLAGVIGYEQRDRGLQRRVNVDGVRVALSAVDPAARFVHVSSVAAVGPVEAARPGRRRVPCFSRSREPLRLSRDETRRRAAGSGSGA